MPNRIRLTACLTLVLTLTASLASAQNPTNNNNNGQQGGRGPGGGGPGGPGGGGGRGPGGGGGGGWGGPGGGGTSPTGLIQNPVIQEELKMSEKQIAQVKQINEEAGKKRTQVREEAAKMAKVAREQAAMQAAIAAQANGGTPYDPNAANNNNGGRGGRGNRNDVGAQVERQAMDNFQKQVETALLKVLEPKQKARIKQIALQAEGPGAFNNPEVIQALALTMEQVQAIDGIRNESRQTQRQMFTQFFSSMNGDNGNGGGNNGGNNNGGGRGGRPDPAMFQTPEFQAKMKTMGEARTKLEDQTMVNVGKALSKAQKTRFNIMIGDKFDISKLRNRNRPGDPATQQAAETKPTPTITAAAPATTEATKAPARKSLRESRGGP